MTLTTHFHPLWHFLVFNVHQSFSSPSVNPFETSENPSNNFENPEWSTSNAEETCSGKGARHLRWPIRQPEVQIGCSYLT